ncbi:MAG: squalene--hopene cyclase [Nitrospira sp.]|nr:squalene--hopene cyclase [Nitrospira sp.]MDE0403699.1 squalene--hopene cyclase [Nitrospira sp.]MDE0485907.1 squalene--hopene cyclase [Nitrospira sp.]
MERVQGRTAPPTVGHAEAVEEALSRGARWLLSQQHPEHGYWVQELEADTTLTSEYIMLRRYIGAVDTEQEARMVRYLQGAQLEDGGWPIYTGAPMDVSASVKAYFALKLAGVPQDDPGMRRARQAILDKGGVVSANVFTKIALALFGQYDWKGLPSMPPEVVLAPKKFAFNMYAISYWSRAVVIPLLVVFAVRRECRIPDERGLEELFCTPRDQINYRHAPPFQKDPEFISWRNFFVWVDRILKVYEKYPLRSVRKKAMKRAEAWLLEHMQGDGGLGAIYPAMANSIFALMALGYPVSHPLVQKALREIEALEIDTPASAEGPSTLHLQPCHSPIWDTALTINALVERGLPVDHEALSHASSWLRSRQTKKVGDWIVSSPGATPGGWYFQFENELYPDVDDTAAVLTALAKVSPLQPADRDEVIQCGLKWALAMQSSNGGWGAYDRDNDQLIFNKIPFADHQSLLDPPTADLTGRCLEMLGALGYDRSHPAVAPALEFLRREQEADGSWYGRWGVNYLYGTWCVVVGLQAIGEDMSAPWIRRAVTWVESKQNMDGGWGESCLSYADRAWAGKGESTPSQTAWALLTLLTAGLSDSLSVARGVNFLLRRQLDNGTWYEPYHVGTGFPRVFYLRYHGYSKYFPMWALAMYRNVRVHGQTRAQALQDIAQAARQRQP